MTNPKGTARETWLVRQLQARGLDAIRSSTNAPGRDVDLRTAAGLTVYECKDRQQLNIHKTLKASLDRWAEHAPAVMWWRVSKKPGAKRATPDGPPIIATTVDRHLDLLVLEDAAYALARAWAEAGGESNRTTDHYVQRLADAVALIAGREP